MSRFVIAVLGLAVALCSQTKGDERRQAAAAKTRAPAKPKTKISTLNKVVFVSTRGKRSTTSFYVANIDGTGVRPLSMKIKTKFPSCSEISCSPTGDRVAFRSTPKGERYGEIYVANVDGTKAVQLTQHPAHDSRPCWSPDGLRLAYQSRRTGREQIFLVDADGKNTRQLTKMPWNYDAAWSPDGSKIAFVSARTGDFEIFVIDVDGKNLLQLTRARGRDTSPDWSPQGGQIVFSSQRDGNNEIYTMRPDGKGQKNLTKHPAGDSWPSFSPDGKFIAFSTDRDGNEEIYVMTIDGRRPTNCSKNPAADVLPDWLLR